jgi:uncharacterized protein
VSKTPTPRALLFLGVLAIAGATQGAVPLPPRPARYATDRTGAFDAARLAALNERLAAFERETSNQVLVYVDRKVPAGTTLEEMSSAAMRAWGVGQKGTRNGVALFVFVDDRKMRIEVGYGLEGALPDAAAHRITDGVIKPFFRKADYAGGVEAGVSAILDAVRTEGNKGSGVTAAEKQRGVPAPTPQVAALPPTKLGWLCPLVTLSPLLLWPFLRSFGRALRWGSLGAGLLSFVVAIVLDDGLWFFGALALLGLSALCWIVVLIQRATRNLPRGTGSAAATTWADSGSSWSSSSSDSSSSSSDSGSSSSDFSGGGGDSGGGGSSDSW